MKTTIALLSLSLLLTGCVNNTNENENNTEDPISSEINEEAQEQLIYIKNIDTKNDKTYIEADQIEWLSEEDETCETSAETTLDIPKCNPNGFLIQNKSSEVVSYEVSSDVDIKTTKFGENPQGDTEADLEEFKNIFTSQKEYFSVAPFSIKIEDGVITDIQERYIP